MRPTAHRSAASLGSTAMPLLSRPRRVPLRPSRAMRGASTSGAVWSSGPTQRRACRCSNGPLRPPGDTLASRQHAPPRIAAMVCARCWPRWSSRRDPSGGSWAQPAPGQIGPRIWPTSCTNCLRGRAMSGASRSSLPTGAARAAVLWPPGVRAPAPPQPCAAAHSAGHASATQPRSLGST
jgi:hypothetical protein